MSPDVVLEAVRDVLVGSSLVGSVAKHSRTIKTHFSNKTYFFVIPDSLIYVDLRDASVSKNMFLTFSFPLFSA